MLLAYNFVSVDD